MIAGMAGLGLVAARARAEAPPWRMALVGGGVGQAGVVIELDRGWKTYWRMPGEAGIPPQFDWSRSTGVATVEVLYPVPGRFHDASGETIGYETRVVFPLKLSGAAAMELRLGLFFAVCKDICIPASASASLSLPASASAGLSLKAASHGGDIADWLGRVPVAGTVVRAVRGGVENGKPVIVVALSQRVDDIFVEAETSAYFRAPVFSGDGLEAQLVVDNIKDIASLKGKTLKLTLATGHSGLEQSLNVD